MACKNRAHLKIFYKEILERRYFNGLVHMLESQVGIANNKNLTNLVKKNAIY